MIEALLLATAFLVGYALLSPTGPQIPRPVRHALSLPFAIAGYALLGWAQIVVGIAFSPVLTAAVLVVLALAAGVIAAGRSPWTPREVLEAVGIAAAVALLSLAVQQVSVVRLTSDSMRYLIAAAVIAETGGIASVQPRTVSHRGLILPLVYTPARALGQFYLPSLMPLLGAAAVASFVALGDAALRQIERRPLYRLGLLALAVVFLLSTNRFTYSFVYVHTHLLFGLHLLVALCAFWLGAVRREAAWFVVAIVSTVLLVGLRPDGFLAVSLVLVPLVATADVPFRWRAAAVVTYSAVTAAWFGLVVPPFLPEGDRFIAVAAVVWAVAALGALPVMRSEVLRRYGHLAAHLLVGVLVVAAVAFSVADPGLTTASLTATEANLLGGEGRWRWTWLALPLVVALAVTAARFPLASWFWGPLLAFPPLLLVLAHLRDGAYRIGPGDSANRMLLHVILVALVFALLAAATASTGRRTARGRT